MSYVAPPASIQRAIPTAITGFLSRLRLASSRLPRGAFGITSWWRSIAHNRSVGGAARSQHLLGLAVDTTPVAGVNRSAVKAAFEAAGLVAIDEGDHIHVQAYAAGKIPAAIFTRLAV